VADIKRNPVGAQGLRTKITVLTKKSVKGRSQFAHTKKD
jgi:hypothetical protein